MQEMHEGSYTYATKELHQQLKKPTTHTKVTNHRLLEGRQKGLDTTAKDQESTNPQAPPKHMH
jgi:hypothetical protein